LLIGIGRSYFFYRNFSIVISLITAISLRFCLVELAMQVSHSVVYFRSVAYLRSVFIIFAANGRLFIAVIFLASCYEHSGKCS